MNWFAPKVLKTEYNKVVADNMELQFLVEELELELKSYQSISNVKARKESTTTNDMPKKIDVKERWAAEFSPKFFVNRLLDYIFESEDVYYDKRNHFFLNKKTNNIIAEYQAGGLLIKNSEVLKIYKKLSNRNELKRMPRGSLHHLYNNELVAPAKRKSNSSVGVKFSIHFNCDVNIHGLLINEDVLTNYKIISKE